MLKKSLTTAAAGALILGYAPLSQAASWEAGDWTLSMSGQINVHNVWTQCEKTEDTATIDGSLVCTEGPGDRENFSVQNGLLPASLAFGANTRQAGWDILGQVGFFPGIATNDPAGGGGPNLRGGGALQNTGLGTTGLDVRQVFLEFGRDDVGTFKLGRDYGIFGFDVIINDMTIQGVGPVHGTVGQPANTTLGSIGVGYIYTDVFAQTNYTTPSFGGFTATIGVFEPLDSVNLSGQSAFSNGQQVSSPGVHGRAAYEFDTEGVSGFLSASFIQQDHPGLTDGAGGQFDGDGMGWDVTAKADFAGLSLMGYYYRGEGIGTTAPFFDAFDSQGKERDSDGYLGQVTYTFGPTKLGVNYGVSNLDSTGNDPDTLLDQHEKYTVGIYHNLTDNLLLVGEYSDFSAENHAGAENTSSNISAGAVLSF